MIMHDSKDKTSGFYEVCSKFSDISLNAPKSVDHKTCDVQSIISIRRH